MAVTINGTTITYPDNTTQTTTTNYQATDGSASAPGVSSYAVGTYMLVDVGTYMGGYRVTSGTYSIAINYPITIDNTVGNGSTVTLGSYPGDAYLPIFYPEDPTSSARTTGQGFLVTGSGGQTSLLSGGNFAVWTGTWKNRGSNPIQMLVQRVA